MLVFSLVLTTVWCTEGDTGALHAVRSGAQSVTGTLQIAGSWLSYPFKVLGNASTNAGASDETLTELQTENEELRATVIQLEEYRQENERLTELLDLSDPYGLETEGARVIAQSADSWSRTITIDKGSDDGMQVGMPILSANGLLGQIETVGATSSVVRLLTDEHSGVSVLIQSNRAEGVLSGSVEGLLYLNYITTDQTVSAGDAVVTSGIGGTHPKGLVVGEVARVSKNEDSVYYTIVVQPITMTSVDEEVLVLTGNETETANAQSTTTPAAASTSSSTATGSASTASSSMTTDSTEASPSEQTATDTE